MKNFLFVLVLLVLAGFVYVKVEVGGDPNSHFNQTTRYTLGANGFWRTAFGLHSPGDAKKEYLTGSGPIVVEWFKPVTEDVDQQVIDNFTRDIGSATGRDTLVVFGGGVDDGTVPLNTLASLKLKAQAQKPKTASVVELFFVKDYSPRLQNELATTSGESSLAISLDAHRVFLQSTQLNIADYLLSSALREFGHQLGLPNSSEDSCIMTANAGEQSKPLEFFGLSEPHDYCQTEKDEISNLKLQMIGN